MPEILAPAGNADMLRAAVYAGADAVYLGLHRLNARRTAGNFDAASLKEAAAFCRARNVKTYLTSGGNERGRPCSGSRRKRRG